MELKYLTDETLLNETLKLARRERETSVEVLHHLNEIERRKLYSELKYSSLFDYCVRHLGYSEGAAQRRISSARLMNKSEVVKVALENGELNLSQTSMIASHVNNFGTQDIPELMKLASESGSAKKLQENLEKKKSNAEVTYGFSVKLSGEEMRVIREMKAELGVSDKELLLELVKFKKEMMEKKKFKEAVKEREIKSVETKSVPAKVIREVAKRADKKCEKCKSGVRLEFHHIKPKSHGGGHEVENLRLLCKNCHGRESFTMGFLPPRRKYKTLRPLGRH